MPFNALTKNIAQGELLSSITNVATALSLASAQGIRFDAISGGNHYYLLILDTVETIYDRFELVTATALSTDTFTITRAQFGTTAKAFPITGPGDPSKVVVRAANNIEQLKEIAVGYGIEFIDRAATPATPAAGRSFLYPVANDLQVTKIGDPSIELFQVDENGLVGRPGSGSIELADQDHDWSAITAPEVPLTAIIDPASIDRTITLFTLKVAIGFEFELHNTNTAQDVFLKPSDGVTTYTVGPGEWIRVKAMVKTPVTGAEWRRIGGSKRRSVHTSSGTFTVPSFVLWVRSFVTGGGGGGGGSGNVSGISYLAGDSGAAGGTTEGFLAVVPGTVETVTVGLAGTAGAANGGAGGAGGTSTFKALSSTGGAGGDRNDAQISGGVGSGGDINLKGGGGQGYLELISTATHRARGGVGGASFWGGGGSGGSGFVPIAGEAGSAPGSGGGGGAAYTDTDTDYAGGAGAAGIVTIEY